MAECRSRSDRRTEWQSGSGVNEGARGRGGGVGDLIAYIQGIRCNKERTQANSIIQHAPTQSGLADANAGAMGCCGR